MEFVILCIFLAIITAVVASHKNRNSFGWFLLGLLFGIFGLLAIAVLPKVENAS